MNACRSDSEAIDFRVASEFFDSVRKLVRRDLATLRLVATHQGHAVPTAGGLLLFGRDRTRHFDPQEKTMKASAG